MAKSTHQPEPDHEHEQHQIARSKQFVTRAAIGVGIFVALFIVLLLTLPT